MNTSLQQKFDHNKMHDITNTFYGLRDKKKIISFSVFLKLSQR